MVVPILVLCVGTFAIMQVATVSAPSPPHQQAKPCLAIHVQPLNSIFQNDTRKDFEFSIKP